ncbi:LysR family transcriptional regulator [uncultured Bartonella sp.]|uniref:LysR family transcriptional regulator n=1 Tax=uncultured Bartonella sp. TaxID=104108 RepID=UPI0025DC09B7|nr:LysR family transcriptional regulator [uncultured Bartonella sp.]
MQNLDPDLLTTFITILETGSFLKASERLYRSQSALTEQMQKLELICGCQLLERGKKGTRPTIDGEKLQKHALAILKLNRLALADMHNVAATENISISITDYLMPEKVAQALEMLTEDLPKIQLSLTFKSGSNTPVHENDLGGFDIIILTHLIGTPLPAYPNSVIIKRDPLYWAGAAKKRFLTGGVLPLIGMKKGCVIQKAALQLLSDSSVPYGLTHTASNVASLQLAIKAGLGIGCLNKNSMDDSLKDYTHLYNLPSLPDIEYLLLYKPEKSDIAEVLRQSLDTTLN